MATLVQAPSAATMVPADDNHQEYQELSFLHRRHKRNSSAASSSSSRTDFSSLAAARHDGIMALHATGTELGQIPKKCASIDGASITSSTTRATSFTSTTSQGPPAYDALYGPPLGTSGSAAASSAAFNPTVQLHIDTLGRGDCLTSALFSPPVNSISVYVVSNNSINGGAGGLGAVSAVGPSFDSSAPAFISLRKSRGSGTCSLVAGAGYSSICGAGASTGHSSAADALRTLSTTTYRWGPGRAPRISLFGSELTTSPWPELQDASEPGPTAWDTFELQNKAIWSRAQKLRTRLGTFEWRYATSSERKDLTEELLREDSANNGIKTDKMDKTEKKREKERKKLHDVKNLLILDRVVQVFGSTGEDGPASASMGGPREVRRPVARLIRNKALRTPGSSRNSAGNGGLLQIDLGEWMAATSATSAAAAAADGDSKTDKSQDEQTDRDMALVLVVSTAIGMLKKEVDRRRGQEAAVLVS